MTDKIDLVIRNASVVTPSGLLDEDLHVSGGRILSIGGPPRTGAREIDATGRIVMPGGVDPHAHIEQKSGMGQWNADTFETATTSAAMGGTTSVVSFAAQSKGERLRDTVANYAARAARGAIIDHAFHITLTDLSVVGFQDDLCTLVSAGHKSFKVFTTYDIRLNDDELLETLLTAQRFGALVCVHAENDAIIAQKRDELIRQGDTKPIDHARSRPRMAEIEAVQRLCRFSEYLQQPVMLFHISTAEAVASIREAKAKGVPVWAETCPHYLFMTEQVLDKPGLEGAKWMCSPPQRTPHDQMALREGLEDGTLDLVSSDHAPYRFDGSGKLSAGPQAGFHEIANGLPGLETRLPLMFDAVVSKGWLSPDAFARLTSTNAAKIYGLDAKGSIEEGKDADLVIWDPEKEVTYGEDDLHDNVGYNPWAGYTVKGWPETVILRGEILVDNNTFTGAPGYGEWIDRAKPDREAASRRER